jgi:hypothetical protein
VSAWRRECGVVLLHSKLSYLAPIVGRIGETQNATRAMSYRTRRDTWEAHMADKNTVIHIGENSPEQVAYNLMLHIARIEDKLLYRSGTREGADRKWVLDTYVECLRAVRGQQRG